MFDAFAQSKTLVFDDARLGHLPRHAMVLVERRTWQATARKLVREGGHNLVGPLCFLHGLYES